MLTSKLRILNPELLARLAALGHGDRVVIADAGLPIPADVPAIDLSLVEGLPSFAQVLRVVLEALVVESATYAREADESRTEPKIAQLLGSVTSTTVSHEELKQLTQSASFVIRTGEFTPFMNICLVAGVPF